MADDPTGPVSKVPTYKPDFADQVYTAAQSAVGQPGHMLQQGLAYLQQMPGYLQDRTAQLTTEIASPALGMLSPEQQALLAGAAGGIKPPTDHGQGQGDHAVHGSQEPHVAAPKNWVKPVEYHIEDRHLNAHDKGVELKYEETIKALREYQTKHQLTGHDAPDAHSAAPAPRLMPLR